MKNKTFLRSSRYYSRQKIWTKDGCAFLAGRNLALRDMYMYKARLEDEERYRKWWVKLARGASASYVWYSQLRNKTDRI